MAITFDKPDRVILITSPQTEVDIQSLVNAIRDYEDELDQLDIPKIANASGKEDLGGGTQVGITLELVNDWRVQFEDRAGPTTEIMLVLGGNLVATNIYDNNPIKASTFTQVQVARSSSGTINNLQIIDLVHRIESLRDSHGRFGKIVYWNPTTGNDAFQGDTPARGVKTFSAAHDLCDADQGDCIFALTIDASSIVEVDEQLVMSKAGVSLRGPGLGFVLKQLTGSGPTIRVEADDIEISGMVIEHVVGTATTGIQVDGGSGANQVSLKNIIIRNTIGSAITIQDSADSRIENCFMEDLGNDGINIGNNVDDLQIRNCIIDRPSGHGIHLSGTSILDTIISGNEIHDATNYGIYIGSGSNQTIVRADNLLFDNIIGDIFEQDGAQNITIEQDILDEPIERIKFGVESLRPHHTGFGKTVYWSPFDGDDLAKGNIPNRAVRSFRRAQQLASDRNNDVIVALPKDTSGLTFTSEPINITKNFIFLRGPGRAFVVRPLADSGILPHGGITGTLEIGETLTQAVSGATAVIVNIFTSDNEIHVESVTGTFDNTNTVTGGTNGGTLVPSSDVVQRTEAIISTGNGTSFGGFRISPTRSGMTGILIDGSGSASDGDFTQIRDMWMDGINIGVSSNDNENSIIRNCVFRDATADSIDINNNTTEFLIEKCIIDGSGSDGIDLTGTGISSVNVDDCQIFNSNGYAINIGSGVQNTEIRGNNFLFNNTAGNVNDQGTNTAFEDLAEEEDQFGGFVSIDLAVGSSGTDFPRGTSGDPVDNITDAKSIADRIGLTSYTVKGGTLTLNAAHANWTFVGLSSNAAVNINNQNVAGAFFRDIAISGTNNGSIRGSACTLSDGLSGLDGEFDRCGLNGTISTANGADMVFFECYSLVPGNNKPVLDLVSTQSASASIRAYTGGLEIRNMDQPTDAMTIDLLSGNVLIDSSCTDGEIVIRGVGDLTDNSTGTVVNTSGSALGLSVGRFQSGTVFIDTVNGVAGTTFPKGTPSNPISNVADARVVADTNGLKSYHLVGGSSITLTSAHSGWRFSGDNFSEDSIDINGQNVDNSVFSNLELTGTSNGRVSVNNCTLQNITSFDGTIKSCSVVGTLGVAASANIFGFDVHAGGATGATIDVGGAGRIVALDDCWGDWAAINTTGAIPFPSIITLNFSNGTLNINNTNTAGTFTIKGTVEVTDNSAGSTVDVTNVTSNAAIAGKVWDEPISGHNTAGTFGEVMFDLRDEAFGRWVLDEVGNTLTLYKDDGVTVLKTFDLTIAAGTVPAYVERDPQ